VSDNDVSDDAGDPGTVGVSVISVTEDEGAVELVCEDQTTLEEVTEDNSTSSPRCGFEASPSSLAVPIVDSSASTTSDFSTTVGSIAAD